MAGIAGESAGVICGRYLRESFWFCAVGFVTAGTDHDGIQLRRCDGRGIVGVFGLGSMAGFAGNDDVLALPFLINDVGMAGLTGIVAGEGYRPGCDLGDRSAAIVAVLPKTARDDGSAQDDERNQCDRHDDDEPDEVLCVLEQVRIPRA
jgi:hypothetical protein